MHVLKLASVAVKRISSFSFLHLFISSSIMFQWCALLASCQSLKKFMGKGCWGEGPDGKRTAAELFTRREWRQQHATRGVRRAASLSDVQPIRCEEVAAAACLGRRWKCWGRRGWAQRLPGCSYGLWGEVSSLAACVTMSDVDKPFIVYIILELLIAMFSVLGNVLVCWAVCLNSNLQSITNFFVVSLAVADIAVGVLAIPFSIVISTGFCSNFYGCLFIACFVLVLTQSSIFSLLAIAIDRYIAIKIPLRSVDTTVGNSL